VFRVETMKKRPSNLGEIFRHIQAVFVLLGLAWLGIGSIATGIALGAQEDSAVMTAPKQKKERSKKEEGKMQKKIVGLRKQIQKLQGQLARYQEQIDYINLRMELHEKCRDCGSGNCDHDDVKCRHWAVGYYKKKRVRVCHQLPHGPKRYSGIDQAISRLEKQLAGVERNQEKVNDKIYELEDELQQAEEQLAAMGEQENLPAAGEQPETAESIAAKIEELNQQRKNYSQQLNTTRNLIRLHEQCRDCNTCICDGRGDNTGKCKHTASLTSYNCTTGQSDKLSVRHTLLRGANRYASIDMAIAKLEQQQKKLEQQKEQVELQMKELRSKRGEMSYREHRERYQKRNQSKDDLRPQETNSIPQETNSKRDLPLKPKEEEEEEEFCDLEL